MIDPNFIVDRAASLPWRTIILGSIFSTTGLSAYFGWRMTKYIKGIAMTDKENTKEEAIDESVSASKLENQPMHVEPAYRWHFDGATRLGKVRSENQDAYTVWQDSDSSGFLAVFDGAGGIKGGREAAQSAANACLSAMKETAKSEITIETRMAQAIDKARSEAKVRNLSGITTAILTYVDGDTLTYATLGDGALAVVWPDGMVSQILVPHHVLGQADNIIAGYIGQDCDVPPRSGQIRIEPGSTLMLMSDGASDLFPYNDFADMRKLFAAYLSDEDVPSTASYFLDEIEIARDPETDAYLHHDNMTLILAHMGEVNSLDPSFLNGTEEVAEDVSDA